MENYSPVRYEIRLADAAAHVLEVSCRIEAPHPAGQVVSLPAWIPGSYLVRDYARLILQISAHSGGQPIPLDKTDKSTWRAGPADGPLEIVYQVYAYDLSVRGAYFDTRRAFINGVCVFLQATGAEALPCEVTLRLPEVLPGTDMARWRVATAMTIKSIDGRGFGTYSAADYDELIDHPFEISDFTVERFEAGGVAHEIVLAGRQRADLQRLCKDLPRICETHMRLFDDAPPMDHYKFLVNVVGEGYGGLEHRASSALITRRGDLPEPGREAINKPYRRFLGLVSHEYFHLWNIKRIKPAAFTPFRLEKEAYTTLLWVFEGITSYYDDLALVRSGLITREAYLELLGEMISRVWQTPGRFRQSLADASFDAWVKLYKPDENSANASVSYYTKGSLAALALDLTIRLRSDNRKSLDDVMRALWQRYGKTGRGLEENGFEQLAEEVTGIALAEFFDGAIRGTDDLPLADLLGEFAVNFDLLPLAEGTENGSLPEGESPAAALGVKIRDDRGRAVLATVYEGGAAQAAGLAGGDELLAIDGLRVAPSGYTTLLRQFGPGETVMVSVFRRDELLQFVTVLDAAPVLRCHLELDGAASEDELAALHDWLQVGN